MVTTVICIIHKRNTEEKAAPDQTEDQEGNTTDQEPPSAPTEEEEVERIIRRYQTWIVSRRLMRRKWQGLRHLNRAMSLFLDRFRKGIRDSHAHVRTFFAQMYIRGRSVYPRIRLEDVQKQKRCDSSRPLAAASDRECLELAHVVPNSKSSMTNVRIHATYTSKRRPQYLDAITGGFLQSTRCVRWHFCWSYQSMK